MQENKSGCFFNVRSLTQGSKKDELKKLIDDHDIELILLEFQKPGAKLIYWISKWKFQDSSYIEKIGQQLTINNKKGGGVALVGATAALGRRGLER